MQTGPGRSPNGYGELFTWLLGMGRAGVREFYLGLRGTDYRSLAEFSRNFGVCMKTVADVEKALELCVRPMRGTSIGRRWASAGDTIRQGGTLTEALKSAEEFLPVFYLPLVEAGERSGRLPEVFQFLYEHCKAIREPLASLRHTWLFPLGIFIAGSLFRVFVCLINGNVIQAAHLAVGELIDWGLTGLIVGFIMLSPARYFIDQIKLALPLLGDLEREIAMHRFFRVMSMMYATGEHRVESMIRMAAKTVSNRAARLDLMKAARAIENQATMTQAFRQVSLLTPQVQTTIETAELSGKLEIGFQRISHDAGSSMLTKLKFIQPILFRIVIVVVILSTLTTLLKIALWSGGYLMGSI